MKKPVTFLNENGWVVLKERYLLSGETPEGMFSRVAEVVSKQEKNQKRWFKEFYEIMRVGKFIPNSPTLFNAGKKKGQLSACFVLPIEDSKDEIEKTINNAMKIQKSGGGTGFSFSKLRKRNPLEILNKINQNTQMIKQAGVRRGANMGILSSDHPNVLEFIRFKTKEGVIENFNVSISCTNKFMERSQKQGTKEFGVMRAVVNSAWASGDPGIIFVDQINRFNPTPYLGTIEATNPCGEQPLLSYESCNLGSIDVSKYIENGSFAFLDFCKDIRIATRFLDNVIDANVYPVPETRRITKINRKIGLGIMGFADLLIQLGVRYDSKKARVIAAKLMSTLDRESKRESIALAQKKGAFLGFKNSIWSHLDYPPLRNATTTTIAPTGTISIIAGCSSGIEPIFAPEYTRNVLAGKKLKEKHKHRNKKAWVSAQEISVFDHVKMQAVFQRFSDSAVSKTINLPHHAKPEEVHQAYVLSYRLGCKGITVFRDGCRKRQVLCIDCE